MKTIGILKNQYIPCNLVDCKGCANSNNYCKHDKICEFLNSSVRLTKNIMEEIGNYVAYFSRK